MQQTSLVALINKQMETNSIGSMLTRTQRLVLGSFVLFLVDIIWVSSSELTKYLYHNVTFEKPFFCTYIKTSMFTLYLLGFLFWPPWRDNCSRPSNYTFIDPEQEDENFFSEASTSLSNPTFIPVKTPDRENVDRSSGTESDDSSIRSVRFNKVAEVRHMSETEAAEALLARLSYQASLRAGELAKRAASKLSVVRVAKIALIFCILWFAANYLYQLALTEAKAKAVTIVSSTSNLFVLLLAAIFPANQDDKFSFSKSVAVCVSVTGIVLISYSSTSVESHSQLGISFAFSSAFFYGVYITFLRKQVEDEDKMDIPMFFGFVGLFNLVILWPLFFFLHYSSWEEFEWPSKHQLAFLLLDGLIGTVLSEALWLWGCFLTSSLIATVAISLTIPMGMMADVLLKKLSYPCLFYAGTVPIVIAFIALSVLSHYGSWDPVLDAIRYLYLYFCHRTRFIRFRFPEMSSEQTEALIGINTGNEHEA